MSIAYCKNCLEKELDCECGNYESVYGDYGLAIASCIKLLKENGMSDAVRLLEKLLE